MWLWTLLKTFSIVKLLRGFNILSGERLGKLIFYGILIAIGLTIYHRAFAPKTTTKIEKIETQIINNCAEEEKFIGFKLKLFGVKLGGGI